MLEKIPFQQGNDSLIVSPKLASLSFGMDISDGIVALSPSTKQVFLHKGGLDCFMEEDLEWALKESLGLFLSFMFSYRKLICPKKEKKTNLS